MTSLTRPRVEFISTILQTVLNLGLLSLGLILVVFLGKETVHLADVLFALSKPANTRWWKAWWSTFSTLNLSP